MFAGSCRCSLIFFILGICSQILIDVRTFSWISADGVTISIMLAMMMLMLVTTTMMAMEEAQEEEAEEDEGEEGEKLDAEEGDE